MNITDILGQIGGIQSMAKELGISESQAAAGAAALAPAILGGFQKQAQAGGVEGLGGLLAQLGGGGLLDNVLGQHPTDTSLGNNVLGQIFGSKDVSRTVADAASSQTGLDSSLLKKMLPMLAMAVAGYMAKSQAGDAPSAPASGGGLGGLLGGLGGANAAPAAGGMLSSMIDANHDGNALDDVLRMAGKMMK